MGDIGKTKRFLDLPSKKKRLFLDYAKASESCKNGNFRSTLFSHGRRTEFLYSGNNWTQKKYFLRVNSVHFSLDSAFLASKNRQEFIAKDYISEVLKNRYSSFRKSLSNLPEILRNGISPVQIWKVSMIGAVLFGMISMSMIYRYLGQGASANEENNAFLASKGGEISSTPQVLGEEDIKDENDNQLSEENISYIGQVLDELEESRKEELEEKIRKMVKGYPIETMVPLIAEKDKIVAAFLIGIAKKESNWGVHVPVLDGQDCFNYWGYRAQRTRMGSGGHTCFDNRKDAVDTVAKRLEWLIKNKKLNTPKKMSIWKCGSECSSDSQVGKWISDVELYFDKLND